MKKLLSLFYGWIGAALAGGILLTASSWIYDTAAKEYSTFYLPSVLYQTFLMSFWVGMMMTPGVIIAAAIRFFRPEFRGPRSLLVACVVALLSMLVFVVYMNTATKNDFPMLALLSITAVFVAALFWWITLKTDRVEQDGDLKPDHASS
jgi:hypothetical protein